VDLWIISYSQLRRQRRLLEGLLFSTCVVDEAQFIKNPDAKATHACLSIKANHRIALSGTPLENRLLDLWTLFRFLMPGLLGSRTLLEDRLKEDRTALIHD
ncbi:SNF2-related protein, partial [Arthrospira platensis SPKY2]